MKRFIELTLVALVLVQAACSFSSRSGAFECSATNPCSDTNRVCSDGWCVLPGAGIPDGTAGAIDANTVVADAFVCPAECTRCESGICVIECLGADDCSQAVVCPAGVPCQVYCDGSDSCAGGIDCTFASVCRISCGGVGACAEKVECGAGLCEIDCTGTGSCAAGLNCSNSCDCNTTCPAGCGINECPGAAACFKNGLCTNAPGSCRTCLP